MTWLTTDVLYGIVIGLGLSLVCATYAIGTTSGVSWLPIFTLSLGAFSWGFLTPQINNQRHPREVVVALLVLSICGYLLGGLRHKVLAKRQAKEAKKQPQPATAD